MRWHQNLSWVLLPLRRFLLLGVHSKPGNRYHVTARLLYLAIGGTESILAFVRAPVTDRKAREDTCVSAPLPAHFIASLAPA